MVGKLLYDGREGGEGGEGAADLFGAFRVGEVGWLCFEEKRSRGGFTSFML